jgi:hypothetical protein
MFYWKFTDEGDNPVNNPNIYNVEGDNSLHSLTTGSVLKIRSFSVRNCMFYTGSYFVVFYKAKHSSHTYLRVVSV